MIHLNQAISLALIYNYRATGDLDSLISYDDVDNYMLVVNSNLIEMESNVRSLTLDNLINIEELFFSIVEDENKKTYYMLKTDDESIRRRKKYMIRLPLDVVVASQKENALETIGLKRIDDQFLKKDTTNSKRPIVYRNINQK